jgi:hypothetical protein
MIKRNRIRAISNASDPEMTERDRSGMCWHSPLLPTFGSITIHVG